MRRVTPSVPRYSVRTAARVYLAAGAEKVMLPDGGVHYRLYDVPGGIGVECLCGSGLLLDHGVTGCVHDIRTVTSGGEQGGEGEGGE